jgi:hypothetical protein
MMKTMVVFKKLSNVQSILFNLNVVSGTSKLPSNQITHKKNSERLFYSLLAFTEIDGD